MTKIKICGLFRQSDIDYVNEAEPDYIGFVFAESKRQVTLDMAEFLRKRLDSCITPVGVFVDALPDDIYYAFRHGIISVAQLHGHEDEDYITGLKEKCDIPIIKAIEVNTSTDILKWQDSSADFLLLDNGKGGTGKKFDWSVIADINKPYFLAGGINLNNIEAAISNEPYCIDVSSGAETNGAKDRNKISQLVQKVRHNS